MATEKVNQAPVDPASAQAFSGPIGAEYEMLQLICPAAADMGRQVGAFLRGWQCPDTGDDRRLKVLEIGCGTGITTASLLHARADTEITAVDIAAPMLAQAQANLAAWSDAGRLQFVEGDALSFVNRLPANSVDVVASGYAFHNFRDDYRCEVVREIYRVLRPGGVLVNGDRYALDDSIEQTRVIQDELRQYFRVFSELNRPDLLEDWTLHLFSDEAPEHVMRLEPALTLYREVGFDPVRVHDRYRNNAVVSAGKAAGVTKGKGQRSVYRCTECGHVQNKWGGQCPGCGVWNTLVESLEDQVPARRHLGYAGEQERSEPVPLAEVEGELLDRQEVGLSELDRVLGGGLVRGSTVLLGGDPGIGKSTLLLQTAAALGGRCKTLYITGEESLGQVSLRARRLHLACGNVLILAETALERILDTARRHAPEILVIDSIQTIYSEALQSAPGSVAQVRECAAHLVRYAKRLQCSVFLIGHVTKEGALAGPRVLEHMVDTVLYFEGDSNSRFRVVRSFKNRFGAVNELGVFAMTETGLREVRNPSAIFLSRYDEDLPGSVVMVMREGSRPILLEVQALVDDCRTGMPRRVAVGMEGNRLAMLLAVLHRHGGMPVMDQDVFINLVGGLRLNETSGDLPVLMAIASSYRDRPVPRDWIVFGEVGLNGEVRPVTNGEERLREAQKQGFRHALVPAPNAPKNLPEGMEVTAVRTLREALAAL